MKDVFTFIFGLSSKPIPEINPEFIEKLYIDYYFSCRKNFAENPSVLRSGSTDYRAKSYAAQQVLKEYRNNWKVWFILRKIGAMC